MLKKFLRRILRWVLYLYLAHLSYVVLLIWVPPPITANMIQAIYHYWGSDFDFKHHNIKYEEMGSEIKYAVVASEDQKFAHHHGFDFASIRESIGGGAARGASTISQQTAKNLFLLNYRSIFRKLLEALFTIEIELLWPKKTILKHYLNVAEFAPNLYGIDAASDYYFQKKPAALSAQNAAFLAAVLPSPKKRGSTEKNQALKKSSWIVRQSRYLQNHDDKLQQIIFPDEEK